MQISSGQTLQVALDAVWAHRFRSLLTVLGIVIGITTVVTVSSLLSGVRKNIVVFFQEFGPDNIFIMKTGGGPGQGNSLKERRRKPLQPEYAEMLKVYCPSIRDTSLNLFIPPFSNGALLSARVPGAESDNINIVGSTANTIQTQPRELRAGRYFTPEEATRRARVAVIGNNVANALFPEGKEPGRTFNLGGAEYTVVGVFAAAKGGFFGENGMDNQIVLPFETAHARYPQSDRYMIVAQAKPGYRKLAQEEIQASLRRIRHVPRDKEDDFAITTADQIIENFDKITGMIVVVSMAISCLGLLVGGIGVMNIMLVSVTERTREIGVRKALGARKFDIVFQFLLEAMTLTGAGGVIGIVVAVVVTFAVGLLVPSLPSEVSMWAVITGFTVSVAVGLFFGVWPAFTASRLDPVEALRYE